MEIKYACFTKKASPLPTKSSFLQRKQPFLFLCLRYLQNVVKSGLLKTVCNNNNLENFIQCLKS